MQSVSSRIWTRIAVSISCDDNHYTTDTKSYLYIFIKYIWFVNTFLNEPKFFLCTQLNGFKYFFLTRRILFTTDREVVTSIAIQH